MPKTKTHLFRPVRIVIILAVAAWLPASAFSQYAYLRIDSSLLAGTPVKKEVSGKKPVDFPEILKGNEAQSMEYIGRFSERRRDYLIRMYTRGKSLLPKAARILQKFNLPEELKVLLILESAYNANAVSKAGAVGYWQFMDAVAREYGLRYISRDAAVTGTNSRKQRGKMKKAAVKIAGKKQKGKAVDDRTHFVKATHAAARYLCDRRRNLNGNWLLVVASYNCGVGNVWEAMQRSGKNNPGFWDIKKMLPAETQAYVMNFITLNVVYHNYEQFLRGTLDFRLPETATDPCAEEESMNCESTAACLPEIHP
jgi:hypothetical protein